MEIRSATAKEGLVLGVREGHRLNFGRFYSSNHPRW